MFASISSCESCGRVTLRPLGSPMRAVKSPMISVTRCPASAKRCSWCSTTIKPRCRSGLVGSMPSLTRSGRPSASRFAKIGDGLDVLEAVEQLVRSRRSRRAAPRSSRPSILRLRCRSASSSPRDARADTLAARAPACRCPCRGSAAAANCPRAALRRASARRAARPRRSVCRVRRAPPCVRPAAPCARRRSRGLAAGRALRGNRDRRTSPLFHHHLHRPDGDQQPVVPILDHGRPLDRASARARDRRERT